MSCTEILKYTIATLYVPEETAVIVSQKKFKVLTCSFRVFIDVCSTAIATLHVAEVKYLLFSSCNQRAIYMYLVPLLCMLYS